MLDVNTVIKHMLEQMTEPNTQNSTKLNETISICIIPTSKMWCREIRFTLAEHVRIKDVPFELVRFVVCLLNQQPCYRKCQKLMRLMLVIPFHKKVYFSFPWWLLFLLIMMDLPFYRSIINTPEKKNAFCIALKKWIQ